MVSPDAPRGLKQYITPPPRKKLPLSPPALSQSKPKVLSMSRFLRNLYILLVKLSPDESSDDHVFGDAVSMDVSNKWFRTRIKFSEITCLSNFLFQKLSSDFELLISGSGFCPPSTASEGKNLLKLDDSTSNEEFLLLLRCCMIMLDFLEFDQSLILEKCQILNAILRKLGHPLDLFSYRCHSELEIVEKVTGSEGLVLHQCTLAHGGMTFAADALPSVSCRILEVFIHDLLLHRQLRKHVVITDYVTGTPDKLFVSHCNPGDLSAIFEVISFHFLLSVCDERAFMKFIQSLSWSTEVLETAELSVAATLALLGIPAMFSAPYMLQAHVILLASKCIGIQMPNNDRKLDVAIFECCMSAFELSVNLYARYISALDSTEFPSRDEEAAICSKELSFGSCIQPITRDRINLQIQNLVDFCDTHFSGFLSRNEVQFLNSSVSYIRENQQVIDKSCREEGSLILNCLVSRILSNEAAKNTMPHKDGRILQVECCLAAVLKLMSSSLLKILCVLKQNSYLGGKRTPMHNYCSAYEFIMGVINSFEKYGAHRHVKNIVFGEYDTQTGSCNVIKLMLEHFSSLALYSFNRRLIFLWNGCIFMMMTVMNLFQFEKDKFDAFSQFLGYTHETSTTQFSAPKSVQDKDLQNSSLNIASNMQSIRKLYSSNQANPSPCGDECVDIGRSSKSDEQLDNIDTSGEEHACTTDEADICNGKIFVDCLSEYQNNPSEWDDLVDFIECRPGKDYSKWLKSWKNFRKWQTEKTAVVKQQRKGKTRRKSSNLIAQRENLLIQLLRKRTDVSEK
ncbi:hypothetical protein J5N97_016198 [Dioscorea zingiberensis]|uniref:DUF7812 domain-containing protein n=1 Tax=Dioscorea zingiberensis TaxID=325984 RepID=A0A9D5CIX8_9LILI|nr:hypothetical protein J5N97_016198 [Dioscorea zingiberensis]